MYSKFDYITGESFAWDIILKLLWLIAGVPYVPAIEEMSDLTQVFVKPSHCLILSYAA